MQIILIRPAGLLLQVIQEYSCIINLKTIYREESNIIHIAIMEGLNEEFG